MSVPSNIISRWLLYQHSPSTQIAEKLRRLNLSRTLQQPLDRVNVLGANDGTYGHTGCVNALSWAQGGQLLLSGGDDFTVRLWSMDQYEADQEYPFLCRAVIRTGHRANIFNVALLPYSTKIASVAGDKQVRIIDADIASTVSGLETSYSMRPDSIRVIRCHRRRVKRLVTEESPDIFLTVAEDGTVRQHDLRTHHICGEGSCPPPLVKLNHELSTISSSPLTPYQFVVAGESPYGYLYDRRHVGRRFTEEWGTVPRAGEDFTTCVRRFGRQVESTNKRPRVYEHVTGVRVSPQNGHEVLLTYSSDAVYLYSTYDEPGSNNLSLANSPPIPSSDTTPRRMEDKEVIELVSGERGEALVSTLRVDDEDLSTTIEEGEEDSDYEDGDDDDLELRTGIIIDDLSAVSSANDFLPDVPLVFPRMRYRGAQNVETIKDVNFLGPFDEFIASGSDDGNFFIWEKDSGKLHGIYEGDGSIVNVIEGHPYLPLIAVSGIDTTVKLFSPARSASKFSRMHNANRIVEQNSNREPPRRLNFAAILTEALQNSEGISLDSLPAACPNQ